MNICDTVPMACLFGARLWPATRFTVSGTWLDGLNAIRNDGIRLGGTSVYPSRLNLARLGNRAVVREGIGVGTSTPLNETLWYLVCAIAARPKGQS